MDHFKKQIDDVVIKVLEESHYSQVVDIFYESSPRKNFESIEEKKLFQHKYLDYYKISYPEYFYIALNSEKVLGYICGSPDSRRDEELKQVVSHYKIFKEEYDIFPAHLHINLSSASRGLGIGSKLVKHFEKNIDNSVHLITSPDAKNRSFYKKNGYSTEIIKVFNGFELLLMGKTKS